MISILLSSALPIFCLLGACVLAACSTALLKMGKFKSKELFRSLRPPFSFFQLLIKRCCPKNEWDNLYFSISITKHILQLSYAIFALWFLLNRENLLKQKLFSQSLADEWLLLVVIGGALAGLSLVLD
ncbi:MAG: hypothetical protein IT584_02220, partial [Chlamydiae bacterium]|nr:hypothetical protein [Chlamydiota bacterium]